MKQKRIIALVLSLILCLSLCGCGKKDKDTDADYGFKVALKTVAGSGFYWDCTLSEDGIVTVSSEEDLVEDAVAGSTITTNYHFVPKRRGEVTAEFFCRRSWDESVYFQRSCVMTVDWDKVITGELSGETVVIRPGDGSYTLALSDAGVVLWTEETDGSFVFTPQRDGYTTLTFTSDEDKTDRRVFDLSVAEDGEITLTENEDLPDIGSYKTVGELEAKLGYFMPLPAGVECNEIGNVGEMGYVNFVWDGLLFAYVGGPLDINAFAEPGTERLNLADTEILLPDGAGTTAAWKKDDIVYYISAEESISEENVRLLLTDIFAAWPAGD